MSASGLDFFAAGSSADQAIRVQEVMLLSLSAALDRLASAEYAEAFDNSTDLDDYRWGMLHRIVFDSALGGPFNVPPAFGLFPDPLADLRGVPTDGGFGTVDASSHRCARSGDQRLHVRQRPDQPVGVRCRPVGTEIPVGVARRNQRNTRVTSSTSTPCCPAG